MSYLKEIFDKVISSSNKKSSSTDPSFKPSMLGTKCVRKLYYSYNRVPEDQEPTVEIKRIFSMGNAVGSMLTDVFRQSGNMIDYYPAPGEPPGKYNNHEFPINDPDLGIKHGQIDGVFILDNKLWLAEFKSINENGFSNLSGPKPDHLIQGITYLYVFNKRLKDGLYSHIKELNGFDKAEGVRFLYVNKNNSQMSEFIVTQNDNVFIEIINKIQSVKDHVSNSTLPEKTPEYCRSCPWNKKCSKNYKI